MTTGPTSTRLVEAYRLAEEMHRGQTRRKTGAPTLSHLMAVAALVMENGGDEDEAIAALLHDGPEDCGGTSVLNRIRDLFGDRVAALVEDCTDSLEEPRPPWEERKRDYLAHLETVPSGSLLVSLADKVHNVRSLVDAFTRDGDRFSERFTASPEQTLKYYSSLLAIFKRRQSERTEPLVSELDRLVSSLKAAIEGPLDPPSAEEN